MIFFFLEVYSSLVDFERATVDVRLDCRLVEDRDRHLGIRRLRSELLIGVTQALTNRVDADERARTEEVLSLQAARAHGVLLRPHGVRVLGQELTRRQLVTRIAARRRLRVTK